MALDERRVVFYAEDGASRVHFAPILEELARNRQSVCYLTSAFHDPVLTEKNEFVRAFYIGMGIPRTYLFSTLRCGVMVMTMPDIGRYQLKRSQIHPVHYVYLFHSMVSTHMIYRTGAFDHYDTILSVGPRHNEEIRAAEAVTGLPPKRLVEHGYGRLDSLLGRLKERPENREPIVLIAPSYGKNALLETCGVELVEVLLTAGFSVIVRPHPITTATSKGVMRELRSRFAKEPRFRLETDVASEQSLHLSDVMISDWSGAALEYAFGRLKPVLFVDVPRKVNNPRYREIPLEPIEVEIRSQIGAVLVPADMQSAGELVLSLMRDATAWSKRIQEVRGRLISNVGNSGVVGCREILDRVDALFPEKRISMG